MAKIVTDGNLGQRINIMIINQKKMKAKQRILRHLRRYKTITMITYQGWGLSNLHERIRELIALGHIIERKEWHYIKYKGKVIKKYRKYKLNDNGKHKNTLVTKS